MSPKEEFNDAIQAAGRIANALGGNRAEIRIDAGGIGVMIATAACMVMLACGVLGALWVSREFARYDTQIGELRQRDKAHEAYLNAIYQAAPQLKPEK